MRRASLVLPALVQVLFAGGCDGQGLLPDGRPSRQHYNDARDAFAKQEWEEAGKGFLEARDAAGNDPELRYSAAFNLGLTLVKQADAQSAEPEKAVGLLRQAAAWFRDAVRLRPEDDDARLNLEIILRHIQLLADQLNKGENSLEARLGRLIEDQRTGRDSIRQLMARVSEAGVKSEPTAFAPDFDELATFERTLLAEAGTTLDLAGEELGLLEGKGEEERTDQDKMRVAQLNNLDYYLQRGRSAIADTRRLLRRLQGDDAHRRADAALAELKRAREQLLDPVTVLKGVVQDEVQLLSHTGALLQLGAGRIQLDGGKTVAPPPWLTTEHLAERQQDLSQRTQEVLARFSTAVEADSGDGEEPQEPAQAQAQPQDPKQARMLKAAGEAVPLLEEAVAAMGDVLTALPATQLAKAGELEAQAIAALLRAIERFSGIRDLIELAYADQAKVIALLTPPKEGEEPTPLSQLSSSDRARLVRDAVGHNQERVARLQGLFEDEVASLNAAVQAQAQAQAQAAGAQGDPTEAGSAEQIEGQKEQYRVAEERRQQAADALDDLAKQLAAAAGRRASSGFLPAAVRGREQLEELRRIFFSIVEHLKDLLRQQAETHDRTASAQGGHEDDRGALLEPLTQVQAEHAQKAMALAEALAAQADAAVQSQDPKAQQGAQALGEAAPEVQLGAEAMEDGARLLDEGRRQAAVASYDLEPTLTQQQKALEHLENAIRILEPPQEQQNQGDQDQQQQQQQQQEQQEQQVSQKQAQRRLQAIRDREAERARNRKQRARSQPQPVEKDW